MGSVKENVLDISKAMNLVKAFKEQMLYGSLKK